MTNDQTNELLSLMGQQIKGNAELRIETSRHFEQLTEVMVSGFLRLEDKLGIRINNVAASVDHLTGRVDHMTEAVAELKTDVREVKSDTCEIKIQSQEANRRHTNSFDHVGELTEQNNDARLRLSHIKEAQQPSNAELDARLRTVEEQLRKAA